MRILFLTSRVPYPPYRGDKLKIFNLIRQLAPRHEIMLLTFIQDRSEEQYLAALNPFCKRVESVMLPLRASLWNCLLAIPGHTPFQVAYFSSASMRRALASAIESFKPEIIHTHLIRMAPYTAHASGSASVLDMTDAVSLYLGRFAEVERNPAKRFAVHEELRRMIRFEPIILGFDRSLVCSTVDREELLKSVPAARIQIMENGVDLETFAASTAQEKYDPRRVIFTGNMSYYPNADGAQYLAKEVMPLVQAAIPDVHLYIVGQNPPRSVRALANDHITVTGFVKDIRAEYAKSAVAVSPVRFGAGTLNKILEPLALGVPVVTTPCGVEGLGLLTGTDLLVADNAKGLADHLVHVLVDPVLRQKLSRAGPNIIRSRFGWDVIVRNLEDVYRDISGNSSSANKDGGH